MRDSRAIRFQPRIVAGQLIISAGDLAPLPIGPSSLLLGMYAAKSRNGAASIRHAVLHRIRIDVAD
jgi:hypothetical protein